MGQKQLYSYNSDASELKQELKRAKREAVKGLAKVVVGAVSSVATFGLLNSIREYAINALTETNNAYKRVAHYKQQLWEMDYCVKFCGFAHNLN